MRPFLLPPVLALLALLAAPLSAQPVGQAEGSLPLSGTLALATQYLDNLLTQTLASLELVAATPEAAQGDWPGIKAYLRKLGDRLPGAYYYIRPDGSYFTVEQDLTELNISDRGYFPILQKGKPVLGAQIHSRSTGKKAAVLAFPILNDGKFAGAVGASVFLDELHRRLNRDLALPADYTWFVINEAGQTMLDRDADFIFMNTLTQGSPSLKAAMELALRAERGELSYELGGILRNGQFQKLPSLDWWMILVRIEGGETAVPARLEFSLQGFTSSLQSVLNDMDAALAGPLKQIKLKDPGELELRQLLAVIWAGNKNLVNASFIDNKGILRYAEASEHRNVEGADISGQEHVKHMLANPKPLLSKAFTSVEGFEAVVIAHPLPKSGKGYLGSVSALVRPEIVVRELLGKTALPPESEIWVMQTDGRIIFDNDPQEIGRLLFSDPLYQSYPSLLELGSRIAAQPSGSGEYIFEHSFGRPKVIKNAFWDTVQLHGTQWRVVLTQTPYE